MAAAICLGASAAKMASRRTKGRAAVVLSSWRPSSASRKRIWAQALAAAIVVWRAPVIAARRCRDGHLTHGSGPRHRLRLCLPLPRRVHRLPPRRGAPHMAGDVARASWRHLPQAHGACSEEGWALAGVRLRGMSIVCRPGRPERRTRSRKGGGHKSDRIRLHGARDKLRRNPMASETISASHPSWFEFVSACPASCGLPCAKRKEKEMPSTPTAPAHRLGR